MEHKFWNEQDAIPAPVLNLLNVNSGKADQAFRDMIDRAKKEREKRLALIAKAKLAAA